MMYFCYIDESGTPEIPGTSSHYVIVVVFPYQLKDGKNVIHRFMQ